jgi:hypothetical protein
LKQTPQRTEPVLTKLNAVLGAELVNGKQEKLGKVTEMLVEPGTGRFREAVIALAAPSDKKVVLRWEVLNWDAGSKRFHHEATREQLELAPVFKPDTYEQTVTKDKTKDADGDPQDGKDKSGVIVDASAPRSGTKLASKLTALRVAAGSDDLGTPTDIYTELSTGTLAFVTLTLGDVLGIGGKTYVVPWTAMSLVTGADQKSLFKIPTMDRKQFENAPRQEGKDDVHKASFRGRLYQFFGVRIPEYEPESDLIGGNDRRGDSPSVKR